MTASSRLWRVIGGVDSGGILVRKGKELKSPQLPTRLSTGAVVKELEFISDRLHYSLVSGRGPDEGWVSVRVSGKELLVEEEIESVKPEIIAKPLVCATNTSSFPAVAPTTSASSISDKDRARIAVDNPTITRLFEVVRAASTVHLEAHMEAPVVSVRSRGMRVIASEVTMNGWLRLTGEPGWILQNMHGATKGLEESLRLVEDSAELVVDNYHSQGLACLEVIAPEGMSVRMAPNLDAEVLGNRRFGECVFAHTQTFDGWVRLNNGDGWIQGIFPSNASTPSKPSSHHRPGRRLLRPRDPDGVEHLDLWALDAAWTTARRSNVQNKLSSSEVDLLKRLEKMTSEAAKNRFSEYRISGNGGALVNAGLVTETQLEQPSSWIKQSIFANLLVFNAKLPAFKDLLGGLGPHFRVPPLPEAEEDQLGTMGFWSAACLPFEVSGATYMMAPNGLMMDPSSQEPVGSWSPETEEVIPLTMVQNNGSTLLMAPTGVLYDPISLQPVGRLNPDTENVEPICKNNPGADHVDDVEIIDLRGQSGRNCENSEDDGTRLTALQKHIEWAEQNANRRCWNLAAQSYTKALEACHSTRSVDIEVEGIILRGRAACWEQLKQFDKLKVDAQNLLDFGSDAKAEEWLALASKHGVKGASPLSEEEGIQEKNDDIDFTSWISGF